MISGDPTVSLPAIRMCAGCGEPFQPSRRGRPGRYCRPACRQRAWALRRAEAELIDEGVFVPAAEARAAPPEAPRGGAPTPGAGEPPAPADAPGWVALLGRLEGQLADPESDLVRRPWEHVRLYDALGRALAALDAVTPGGLEWLDRHA